MNQQNHHQSGGMTDMATDIAVVKKLEPCPFCENDGSGPIEEALHVVRSEYDWRQDGYTIQCDKCSATMGDSDTEEEAVEAWNRRALSQDYLDLKASHDAAVAALQNASGLIDSPLGRRWFKNDEFYSEVVNSIRAVLAALTTPAAPAAVPPADDGWIAWAGGNKSPVRGEVEVVLRKGTRLGPASHRGWVWSHHGDDYDIVAYRPAAGGAL